MIITVGMWDWEDGRNGAVKKAMIKNNVEQTVYRITSRSLDSEWQSLVARRIREERAVRAQLRRLQLEQRFHDDIGERQRRRKPKWTAEISP